MERRKRIVVTGMGVLSSIASSPAEFKRKLLARTCGIKPSEEYAKHYDNAIASEVLQPVTYEGLDPQTIARLDKVALWGYKVGRDALLEAGLLDSEVKERTGVFVGLSAAGTEPFLPLVFDRLDDFSPQFATLCGPYFSSAAAVASLLQLRGGYEVVATACTASTNALGLAFDQIVNGKSETALVVGTEPLYLPTFAGFYALKAMREAPCTPFSGTPGMSIGEGAGALVLETYEHAKARGAPMFAEILGYATSSDAHHETAPDPRAEGATRAMQRALSNAGLQPADVQYVNAHGTGTEANDRSETLAMKKVFPNVEDLPISSTKSYVGHSIGSAGIIEYIACLLTLPGGNVLPTLNFTKPRVGCDLNYVPNEFQKRNVRVFMKNNYGFGGNNCCIVTSLEPGSVPNTNYRPRRVGISGLGIVSSLGWELGDVLSRIRTGEPASEVVDIETAGYMDTARRLFDGRRPKGWPEGDDPFRLRTHEVNGLEPRKYVKSYDARKATRVGGFALVALEQALRAAGRKIRRDGDEYALILGMSRGPQAAVQRYAESLSPDPRRARTSEFPTALMNSVATFCSITKRIKGYNTTLATGYNAAFSAMTYGYELVRQGLHSQALVGGADEKFYPTSLALGADEVSFDLAPNAFQTYSADRRGHLLGEGAGVALIEDLDAVRQRGGRVLAEIAGYGRAGDADYVPGRPCTGGTSALAVATRQALDEAGLGSQSIDVVCGTSWGDPDVARKELEAVRAVFGERSREVPLVNYNGHFGFVESSAAMLNIAVLLDCMDRGELLPIPHTRQYCADDIAFVKVNTQLRVRNVLLLGLTDGGNAYAVVLRREANGV